MAAASTLIARARRDVGISQAELARRARLPRSTINAYERGARDPGARALDRILGALGMELSSSPAVEVLDEERCGLLLKQVLDLADALPHDATGELRFPRLPQR